MKTQKLQIAIFSHHLLNNEKNSQKREEKVHVSSEKTHGVSLDASLHQKVGSGAFILFLFLLWCSLPHAQILPGLCGFHLSEFWEQAQGKYSHYCCCCENLLSLAQFCAFSWKLKLWQDDLLACPILT